MTDTARPEQPSRKQHQAASKEWKGSQQGRGNDASERERDGCQEGRYPPSPAPTYILSMTFMAWNTLFGQFGSIMLSVFLPASCICKLARLGKQDGVLGLIHNNWYHQGVYQHSSHTKSKTHQLLRGKLTPSLLKPGHTLMIGVVVNETKDTVWLSKSR